MYSGAALIYISQGKRKEGLGGNGRVDKALGELGRLSKFSVEGLSVRSLQAWVGHRAARRVPVAGGTS